MRVCSWHNHLNPDIRKTPWTEEEDRIILEKHEILGNQWAKIAEYLPGRCVLSCAFPLGIACRLQSVGLLACLMCAIMFYMRGNT